MLDPKFFRQNLKELKENLYARNMNFDIDSLSQLEEQRKELQIQVQDLQMQRNIYAKQIGEEKRAGHNIANLQEEAFIVNKALDTALEAFKEVQDSLFNIQSKIPNILDASVPIGKSEADNIPLRYWGKPPSFDFIPKDHSDLGEVTGWIDYESAAKMSGSRFAVLKGPLPRLQRALIQWMLDVHTQEYGYQEVYVPYLVSAESLYGTGQLPKFEEDQFKVISDPRLYMIPTAEVSITNLVRDKILKSEDLPLRYVAHTPCFRKEAGSYGTDTKGLIRQHQFEKVELVHIVKAQDSAMAHELLTQHAESILQRLQLPYRVMLLCSADTGFASMKTYDLEVWLPGQNQYREISSCSQFGDFQARRLKVRWRNPQTAQTEWVYTLNGSGLAVGRTLVAILENYQDNQGNIHIPEVLWPYMQGLKVLNVE